MKIEIYTKENCPFCTRAKDLIEFLQPEEFIQYKLGEDFTREELIARIPEATKYPQIIIDGRVVGGYEDLVREMEPDTH